MMSHAEGAPPLPEDDEELRRPGSERELHGSIVGLLSEEPEGRR